MFKSAMPTLSWEKQKRTYEFLALKSINLGLKSMTIKINLKMLVKSQELIRSEFKSYLEKTLV